MVENVVTGEGSAGAGGEVGEESELLGGEVELAALAEEFTGGEVEFEVAEGEGGRLLGFGAAEEGVGSGDEFADAEGGLAT